MKIAYIAHPINGDVKENLLKITRIVWFINEYEPETVPFVPYFADCLAMDDNSPRERRRGIRNDHELIKRGFIDEIRLYGDGISPGMFQEVELALDYDIPVVAMTDGMQKELDVLKRHHGKDKN